MIARLEVVIGLCGLFEAEHAVDNGAELRGIDCRK
jgi:hypothetical protein